MLLHKFNSVNETLESLGDKFSELIEDNAIFAGADTTLCKEYLLKISSSVCFSQIVVFLVIFSKGLEFNSRHFDGLQNDIC